MKSLGRHILVEYYNCNPKVLDDVQLVEESMREAAVRAGSTVVDSVFRRFAPQGISGVVVIAESHLAIHTWPEYGYAAVDLFTCGERVDPWTAHRWLKGVFQAGDVETRELHRGELRVLGDHATHKPAGSAGPVSTCA